MTELVAAGFAALLAFGFIAFSWAAVEAWARGMPSRLVTLGWAWVVWMIALLVLRLVAAPTA